jgi:short-subunit dehydrogenase
MTEATTVQREPQARRRALITGASSGIGAAFAERLARDGYDLVVVARRRERLMALAERLHGAHGIVVEVLAADLIRADDLLRVEQRLAADDAVSLLVNNAGFGGYAPFLDLDPDRAEELIRLHTVAPVRLARAALPGMVARGRGAIVNVSSMLAYSAGAPISGPFPKRAVYAAAKSFTNTFTEILHGELEGTGVQVQALCPAIVRTEFHRVSPIDMSRMPADSIMEPEGVVQASLTALRLGEVICVPFLDDASMLTESRNGAFREAMSTRRDTVAPHYR